MSVLSSLDQTLIYIHIGKTGGTTFLSISEKNFSSDERLPVYTNTNHGEYVKSHSLERIKYVYGHMFFGIHHYIPFSTTYITLLRDPVDRVISEFYFNYYKPNVLNKQSYSFDNIEEFIDKEYFCNHQSKILLGNFSLPENAYEQIQNIINQHFSLIGITELFDESIFLIKKQFGWKEIEYRKENVTKNRPKKEDISQSLLDKIAEKNQVDIAVYNYTKKLFLDKLQGLDEDSNKELINYKSRIKELNS